MFQWSADSLHSKQGTKCVADLESSPESLLMVCDRRYSITFLVTMVALSFSSLGSAGVAGDRTSSLPSTIRFMFGFKGFPVTLSILRVLMSPKPSGKSSILLCWIANTRNAFILSISFGTSPISFRLRSTISSCGSPKTCGSKSDLLPMAISLNVDQQLWEILQIDYLAD